jgi:hypothetical protein
MVCLGAYPVPVAAQSSPRQRGKLQAKNTILYQDEQKAILLGKRQKRSFFAVASILNAKISNLSSGIILHGNLFRMDLSLRRNQWPN